MVRSLLCYHAYLFADLRTEEMTASGRVQSQDVVFVIEEKPHPTFKRDGDDLIYHVRVPLVDCLTGPSDPSSARKTLPSLDRRLIQYTLPFPSATGGTPLKPGQEIIVKNEGFPISRTSSAKRKGDLKVVVDVVFPDRVNAQQAQAIRNTFSSS